VRTARSINSSNGHQGRTLHVHYILCIIIQDSRAVAGGMLKLNPASCFSEHAHDIHTSSSCACCAPCRWLHACIVTFHDNIQTVRCNSLYIWWSDCCRCLASPLAAPLCRRAGPLTAQAAPTSGATWTARGSERRCSCCCRCQNTCVVHDRRQRTKCCRTAVAWTVHGVEC
jgi:hypothetical protein